MKKILFISGARPNLIKLAPLYQYFKNKKFFSIKILHTNQHSDKYLFKNICNDLNLNNPDFLINKINAKNNVDMINYFMKKISKVLDYYKPDCVVIFGDVDTTLAAGLAAAKKGYFIFHIEAGLRSTESKKMQEEINRKIVDHIADINFCTTSESLKHLTKENLEKKSYFVGNIIFDNYFNLKDKIDNSKILEKLSIIRNNYILVTIHRYQNIDNKESLNKLCILLNKLSKFYTVIFTCHSRTKKNLKQNKLMKNINKDVVIINPQPYTDFTKLLINSKVIVTDSGGVHEEAYFHQKKCLVLRKTLEREEFINTKNTIKVNFSNVEPKLKKILKNKINIKNKIEKWDGKVSKRIYQIIKSYEKNLYSN
jgi:UDP-N-acetylglucosamine 2-epimerase (non-hydrolysing)